MPENISNTTSLPDWPTAHQPAIRYATIRQEPADFVVIENTGITPDGHGEHLWLRLRKTGLGTQDAVKKISEVSGVPVRDIGYAGLKDRHAITEQWFSVLCPVNTEPDWLQALPASIQCLQSVRHGRKLKKGALKGNRFTILLRALECDDRRAVEYRLQQIQEQGFPNYFGDQRFGHNGANITKALAMFNRSMKVRNRFQRGMFLSAARSWIFNRILAERVTSANWNQMLEGELCILNGSKQYFRYEPGDADIPERLATGDIHPSGALWGDGEPETGGLVLQLEKAVAAREPGLVKGLSDARMKHDRRALRVIPQDLSWQWINDQELSLSFSLPAGAYATALLRELGNIVPTRTVYADSGP